METHKMENVEKSEGFQDIDPTNSVWDNPKSIVADSKNTDTLSMILPWNKLLNIVV
jgi:hypothetical protein